MKIRIDAKELKTLLEKVLPQAAKSAYNSALECVKLESKDNVLSATTTDLDSYLTVTTDQYDSITDGTVLIHRDDIKLINKLSGELEISLLLNNEIIIKTEKKSITVMSNLDDYPDFERHTYSIPLFAIQESEFTIAINKLANFVSCDESNKLMQCYNINMRQNRIEALDGYRIGIVDITPEQFTDSKTIMLHNKINNDLKKVLNNKSMNYLQFAECKGSNAYYVITGKNFTYIQRQIDGDYFNVEQLLFTDYNFKMTVDKKELLEITKFDIDMLRSTKSKNPMVIRYDKETDNHYIYLDNGRNKAVDKLNTISHDMSGNDLLIGFNPQYINDTLKCLDDDNLTITGTKSYASILISGENERYLILPIKLNEDLEIQIDNLIRKAA